jgi:hypothetical protein
MRTLLIAVTIILTGCASQSPQVTSTTDPYKGVSWIEVKDNKLGDAKNSNWWIELNPTQFRRSGGSVGYYLRVFCHSPFWVFINEGESLVLMVDGKRIGLTGEGSLRHRIVDRGGVVLETADYAVSLDQIKTIANAQNVTLRVYGSRSQQDRFFTPKNFAVFRDFVDRVQLSPPATSK